ncbi:hypothetical protein DENSPDRAFT_436169 [Dentipellis sp. KUC8613]|nr:hypothetical protein DENSPDRAFT_436169 [Dentipellis sp. KUC8613]
MTGREKIPTSASDVTNIGVWRRASRGYLDLSLWILLDLEDATQTNGCINSKSGAFSKPTKPNYPNFASTLGHFVRALASLSVLLKASRLLVVPVSLGPPLTFSGLFWVWRRELRLPMVSSNQVFPNSQSDSWPMPIQTLFRSHCADGIAFPTIAYGYE